MGDESAGQLFIKKGSPAPQLIGFCNAETRI